MNKSDSNFKFLNAGLIGIGAGMGELSAGAVSTINYFSNWASMVTGGFGVDEWGEEHAAELSASHEMIGNVAKTLASEEGRQSLAFSAFETVEDVIKGDTGAIARTTGFFGQIGTGGAVSKVTGAGLGRLTQIAKPKLAVASQATRIATKKIATATATTTQKVVQKSVNAIIETTPRITGEVRKGIDKLLDKPIIKNIKSVYSRSKLAEQRGSFDLTQKKNIVYERNINRFRDTSTGRFVKRSDAPPSVQASAWQGTKKYPGIDKYWDIKLKKGTRVYGGVPNPSGYFTTLSAIKRAGGSSSRLSQGLQIRPSTSFKQFHPITGKYRPGVTVYEVTEDIEAAMAHALANPQYGAGRFPQLYIPEFETKLRELWSIPLNP